MNMKGIGGEQETPSSDECANVNLLHEYCKEITIQKN
jgi:hypothetical protein